MARGGISSIKVDYTKFEQNLVGMLSRVDRGTKKASISAAKEILKMSLQQVPRETNALAGSAYFEVKGRIRNFSVEIGYGGKYAQVNPKTGRSTNDYMVVVHEDLSAHHPKGKAKFLEDPIREYQMSFGARAANILRSEIGI
ncbi:hypothetical protein D3C75_232940 [compost metagenome]